MKQSTKPWFIKVRGSYLPSSWQGWLIYLPYLAYIVSVLVFVFVNNYDLWHAIVVLVPNWIAALVIMTWIAERRTK